MNTYNGTMIGTMNKDRVECILSGCIDDGFGERIKKTVKELNKHSKKGYDVGRITIELMSNREFMRQGIKKSS